VQGENGQKITNPVQSEPRHCYGFSKTLIADCNLTFPDYTRLTSCGPSSGGQCCFGQGMVGLLNCNPANSEQEDLQDAGCSGTATP
jgi:hypothetical protein